MNLYHHLAHAPHEQLRRIAQEFGVSNISPSKRNLLHTISQRYREEGFLGEILSDMPDASLGLLKALLLFVPVDRERVTIPDTISQAWSAEAPLRETMEIFQDKGLIFGEITPTAQHLIFAEEVRELLHDWLRAQAGALQPVEAPALPEHPYQQDIIDAVFHLLSVFYHHRAHITLRGNLHKKIYERWAGRCHPSLAHETIYNLALEFCLNRGLAIAGSKQEIFRPSPHCEAWFAQGPAAMHRDLWEFYLKSIIWPDVRRQKFLFLLASVAIRKEVPLSQQVFPIQPLQDAAENILGSDTTPGDILEKVRILSALRLLQLDSWEQPRHFAYTQEGAMKLLGFAPLATEEIPPPEPCILQPNFQLLVPPTAGYDRLWNIEQLAEFQRRDVLTEYHLTQTDILAGMRKGWAAKEIFTLFEEYSRGRIPENVRISLEEWTGRYGQVQFQRTVLVKCANKDLADEIAHIPELKGMLQDRVAERCFAVEETDAHNLFRLLQERGYEPASIKKGHGEDPLPHAKGKK